MKPDRESPAGLFLCSQFRKCRLGGGYSCGANHPNSRMPAGLSSSLVGAEGNKTTMLYAAPTTGKALLNHGVITMGNNYRNQRFCENLNVAQFETAGKYNIPVLQPCTFTPCEFVGFNFARSSKHKANRGLHFFVDDYQFERLWRMPEQYIDLLSEFQTVMTPDFSLYTDWPKAIQIYNHYRKHWLGAYWQSYGLQVIPTIAWSDRESFEWCFDGTPKGATVAVSSVGTQVNQKTKRLFLDGWHQMMEILNPETVIFYGDVPQECKANIVRVKAFSDKFKVAMTDGLTFSKE